MHRETHIRRQLPLYRTVEPERAQALQFLEVARAQVGKLAAAEPREPKPHEAMIRRITRSPYESCVLGTIDQLDSAVVPQQQDLCHVTKGWRSVEVTANGQEELVLCGREPFL
jgi:hypothetical protein